MWFELQEINTVFSELMRKQQWRNPCNIFATPSGPERKSLQSTVLRQELKSILESLSEQEYDVWLRLSSFLFCSIEERGLLYCAANCFPGSGVRMKRS